VNMNIAVSKIVVLQVGPKTQNDNFLEFWLHFKTSCRPCP
jgi:hypothetical protein